MKLSRKLILELGRPLPARPPIQGKIAAAHVLLGNQSINFT